MTALWIVLAVVVYFGFACGVGAYLGWVSAHYPEVDRW